MGIFSAYVVIYIIGVTLVVCMAAMGAMIGLLTSKIGLWGIFSKAGVKEWKSIVPIYNQITLLKTCKLSPWFILLYIDFLIPLIGYLMGRDVTWALIVVGIGYIVYRFLISIRLGMAFKKKDVFSFFTAFFPAIMYPVLGCCKGNEWGTIETKKDKKEKK